MTATTHRHPDQFPFDEIGALFATFMLEQPRRVTPDEAVSRFVCCTELACHDQIRIRRN